MTDDEIRDTLQDIADITWDADPETLVAALAEALRRLPAALALEPEGRQ